MVYFRDRAFIDGPARITREGHFVAKARVARANNIQDYRVGKGPGELDIADRDPGSTVRIFRPEAEIFAKDSLATALHRPVVIDHPTQDVNANNWKQLAVGDTGGDVLRDGDIMSVPIMVMDSAGVKAVQTTHPEFSWGYSGEIDMTPGKFGDAEYDGSLRNVRYNHLAMCDRARGGSDLRVTDSLVILDERPSHLRDNQEQPMKIKIGDAEVDATNGEAVSVAVKALDAKMTALDKRATDAEAKVVEHTATITAKDAKIAELEKQVADSAITPAKLADAAKVFADVQAKAKALGVTVSDDADTAAIKKVVVTAKMGDAAKDYSDEHIAIAFDALTKDAKVETHTAPNGQPVSIGDAGKAATDARTKMIADMMNPAAAAA